MLVVVVVVGGGGGGGGDWTGGRVPLSLYETSVNEVNVHTAKPLNKGHIADNTYMYILCPYLGGLTIRGSAVLNTMQSRPYTSRLLRACSQDHTSPTHASTVNSSGQK